ncbi:sigma-B regulation protein RsbU [Gloeobacter kilaueensis JS1]|uniref:Sigma-B regulation protein RsbU n=2 Tax=Gloeobacter TaxID=33071 RepID=U5QKS7_GLOK1|nr:GAF domain-containing SpoIIE family protein phosphatase [Gloeobacter kilaueensis]AGY58219.1 sigma-B regulation protein RsbU [Gloeobacter kilaueensis JS1]
MELASQLSREQRKIQDLLSSLGFALRSLSNLNQLLELIPLMAARVTDAEAGAVVLFAEDNQLGLVKLYCPDANWQPSLEALLEPLRELHADQAAAIEAKLASDPWVVAQNTSILVKSALRGRLYVFSRVANYHWTEGRQKLLRLVADQTAVAVENDTLNKELQRKEKLDRELEIGSEIQAQLLPRSCPRIEGIRLAARCLSADKVGGDYYDFIPIIHTNRWGIVIGDVMGKGVPAGLLMTMTRGMLRAEVLRKDPPALILEHLNHVMYADLENSNRFVTLFYSEYDPTTRTLHYSNAAHNPPLYWSAHTQEVHLLDTQGMLIGLEPGSLYQQQSQQLNAGDVVIYYTDGFTDAADRDSHRFGEQGLNQAVRWAVTHCESPEQILEYLFEQLRQFCPNGHCGDDMTLIVLKAE